MSATYTFDVFCSLDGYGSHEGDWGGYWGKQGPELLDHRLASYDEEQRMVFGGQPPIRDFVEMLAVEQRGTRGARPLGHPDEEHAGDGDLEHAGRSRSTGSADATVANGDAVDIVTRLKEESELPLRSHGSLSLNRALMAAGLIDRVQVTIFPVLTGATGTAPDLRRTRPTSTSS